MAKNDKKEQRRQWPTGVLTEEVIKKDVQTRLLPGAIGFAVYLDLLANWAREYRETDVDVVVLYDENVCVETLTATINGLVAEGNSVSAQKAQGELRCKRLVDLRGDKTC